MRVLLLVLTLSASGCAVVQKIDSAIDCGGICEKYAACFDKSFDTAACAARCRDNASKDQDFRRKADMCNACITERSCVDATFSCVSNCVSVVP